MYMHAVVLIILISSRSKESLKVSKKGVCEQIPRIYLSRDVAYSLRCYNSIANTVGRSPTRFKMQETERPHSDDNNDLSDKTSNVGQQLQYSA
ncbi:hypothetical protein F4678DRAFT_357959 [Xylaria arbuscula]|nr:hypothetical protein F4678DRAFT_357959 [Xylaria arbuscula]